MPDKIEELFDKAMKEHNTLHAENELNALMDQACEECAELIVALQHYRRGRSSAVDLLEEYIDIQINLIPILEMLGFEGEDCENMMFNKLTKFYNKVLELKKQKGL